MEIALLWTVAVAVGVAALVALVAAFFEPRPRFVRPLAVAAMIGVASWVGIFSSFAIGEPFIAPILLAVISALALLAAGITYLQTRLLVSAVATKQHSSPTVRGLRTAMRYWYLLPALPALAAISAIATDVLREATR